MQDNAHKIKLLKLYEMLKSETDEDHPLSRRTICARLNDMGISCNLRVVARDIATLNEFGFEVMSYFKDREICYYVPERVFSLSELKVLIDAVQAANFIPEKQTNEIIEKIADLGGSNMADLLQKNYVVFNTKKHSNKQTLYSIEAIEAGIDRKKKVAFDYFDLGVHGEKVYRCKDTGEKKRYYVEPVALIYSEDFYYLMTYSSRHPETTANYRVDRMELVEVVEESEISEGCKEKIDGVAQYTEQVFKMYNGDLVSVVLGFDRSLVGVVFDKFGENVAMKLKRDGTVECKVEIRESPVFYGWVFQFGGKMRIIGPKKVKEQFEGMKKIEEIE